MIPRGVTFDRKSNKYRAYLDIGNKRIYLGFYENATEAEKIARLYRLCIRNSDGIYNLTPLISLKDLYASFCEYQKTLEINKSMTFREYIINRKIDINKYTTKTITKTNWNSTLDPNNDHDKFLGMNTTNEEQIYYLYLNTNTPYMISQYLCLSRRFVNKTISQLQSLAARGVELEVLIRA